MTKFKLMRNMLTLIILISKYLDQNLLPKNLGSQDLCPKNKNSVKTLNFQVKI